MAPRARQAKSKARLQQYEELASEEQNEKVAQNEIVIPPAPRLGNDVVIAKDLAKATATSCLFDDLSFCIAARRHRRGHRAERRRQDDALPDDRRAEKPDGGTLKVGETVQLAYVDQGRELDGRRRV